MSAEPASRRGVDGGASRVKRETEVDRESSGATKGGSKPGLLDRAKGVLADLRSRYPFVDHAVRAVQHFSSVQAAILAGAVTYFGLLSFFPIIALVFAGLAIAVRFYDGAETAVLDALRSVLPGVFDQLDLGGIEQAATAASIIGVVGFLYSGLGWLSTMRSALQNVFEVPADERGNMFLGKATDLLVLATLGVVLIVSVAASSAVTSLTTGILDVIGLGDVPGISVLVTVLGIALGVAASTLLFFVMYRLLGKPELPARPLWRGAFVSAVGFEVLKLAATLVISGTATNPIYGAFAVIIAMLVWINYFSRLALLGASWAVTSPEGCALPVERRGAKAAATLDELRESPVHEPVVERRTERGALLTGALLGGAAVAFVMSFSRPRGEGRERR